MAKKIKLIDKLELSYFFSRGGNAPYLCIHSESKDFKENTPYLIYDIPELLRLMIIKKELMEDDLVNYYYRNSDNSICLILEWSELVRKVVRISTTKDNSIVSFHELIQSQRETISSHFQKELFRYQDHHETV